MTERTVAEIEAAIEDVRANMPWSDDRDEFLDDLYAELDDAQLQIRNPVSVSDGSETT